MGFPSTRFASIRTVFRATPKSSRPVRAPERGCPGAKYGGLGILPGTLPQVRNAAWWNLWIISGGDWLPSKLEDMSFFLGGGLPLFPSFPGSTGWLCCWQSRETAWGVQSFSLSNKVCSLPSREGSHIPPKGKFEKSSSTQKWWIWWDMLVPWRVYHFNSCFFKVVVFQDSTPDSPLAASWHHHASQDAWGPGRGHGKGQLGFFPHLFH